MHIKPQRNKVQVVYRAVSCLAALHVQCRREVYTLVFTVTKYEDSSHNTDVAVSVIYQSSMLH